MAAKTSIGLAALAVMIAGCAAIENLDDGNESIATPQPVTVPAEPYEAVLLDGTDMTLVAGEVAHGGFTEGVPTAIHSLNLLAQAGDCHQIENDAKSWTAEVSTTEEGRAASAFAKHANNIYRYLDCGKAAQPVQAVQEQGEVRFDTCEEAIRADGGNYLFGIDVEYGWYEDRDGDGVVCENR